MLADNLGAKGREILKYLGRQGKPIAAWRDALADKSEYKFPPRPGRAATREEATTLTKAIWHTKSVRKTSFLPSEGCLLPSTRKGIRTTCNRFDEGQPLCIEVLATPRNIGPQQAPQAQNAGLPPPGLVADQSRAGQSTVRYAAKSTRLTAPGRSEHLSAMREWIFQERRNGLLFSTPAAYFWSALDTRACLRIHDRLSLQSCTVHRSRRSSHGR